LQIYLPIAELPISVLLILAMSGAVGFVSGLFGVGGGFLMTPLLIFLGIPPSVAVATVAPQIAAASMTGAITYWRRKALDVKLGLVLIVGGVIGTVLGVLFFNYLRRAGQLELIIVLSYVTLFTIMGSLMLVDSLRERLKVRAGKPLRRLRRAGAHPPWMGLPFRLRFHRSRLYASALPLLGLAALIGFIGAVLGIGGGFILVPALIYMFRVPTSVVVGTSLFQILVTMTLATVFHAVTNQSVDIMLALLLIIGGVVGAQLGTRAARNIKADEFKLLLALLVLAVGIRFSVDLVVQPHEPFSISVQRSGP
jgi:uncharacterized protein